MITELQCTIAESGFVNESKGPNVEQTHRDGAIAAIPGFLSACSAHAHGQQFTGLTGILWCVL